MRTGPVGGGQGVHVEAGGGYTGVDNLEVMASAVNYRRYLTGLVAGVARPGDRLLDFGAGTGTHAVDLRDHGFDVVCVESDVGLCAALGRRGFESYTDLAEASPERAAVVYSINVLEHIEDDRAVLRAIARAVRPGTRLVIYVPAFPSLFSSMDRKVGHHRRYRAAGLHAAVQEAGFRVEELRYVDSLGYPATVVYKVIGNDRGDLDRRGVLIYDRWVFPASLLLDRLLSRWIGKNLLLVATVAA